MNAALEAKISALRRQAELHPSDPDPPRALADELERAERYLEAVAARRMVVMRRPDRPFEYLLLARALVLAGGEDEHAVRLPCAEEATVALRTAVELDPDFSAAYRELARLDLARARVLRDAGAVQSAAERAVLRCRRALELDPGDAEAFRVLGELHLYVAEAYGKARECFARAIELDAANTDARALLALSLARDGDKEAARRELSALLEADPSHPLAAAIAKEAR
jgi:cytochrome c-type biogenesis protein CcmH/NrfG